MHPFDLGLMYQEARERVIRLPNHPTLRQESDDLSAKVLPNFPRLIQLDRYSCSVAVTRAVLEYFGDPVSELDLTRALEVDPEEGADEKAVAKVLRGRGRSTRMRSRMRRVSLINQIDLGNPVVVCLDEGAHWSVVYGYSEDSLYLMDSNIARLLRPRISNRAFARRWDGWGMIVS